MKPSLSEKTLERFHSEYIRRRDATINKEYGRCCTCNKIIHWKDGDAGHYEKRQHTNIKYHERNAHLQCQQCNRFKGGMQAEYALFLERKYGLGILQELDRLKWIPRKLSPLDIAGMIEGYKEKIKKLK